MTTMTVDQVKKLVGSKFFEIEFIKKDNTTRRMNARIGVKAYVVPEREGKVKRKLSDKVVGLWDRSLLDKGLKAGKDKETAGRAAYRCTLPESIINIRVGGKNYNREGVMIWDDNLEVAKLEAAKRDLELSYEFRMATALNQSYGSYKS